MPNHLIFHKVDPKTLEPATPNDPGILRAVGAGGAVYLVGPQSFRIEGAHTLLWAVFCDGELVDLVDELPEALGRAARHDRERAGPAGG